jgi:hypothetical protein
MNREHVLAVILILSLGANIYLLFADQSSIGNRLQGLVSTGIPGSNTSPDLTPNGSPINNSTVDISGGDSLTEPFPELGEQYNISEILPNETLAPLVPETVIPTPPRDQWTTYTSKKFSFSIDYPVSWELNDGSTGSPGRMLMLTAPPEMECDTTSSQCFKYIATMTIEVDKDPQTLALEEYFNSAVVALQKEYEITATSRSASCMLAGARAYQIEFYTRDERGNPDRSYMQYYTLIDKKAYIISYTGPYSTWENVFSIHKGDAQRIIDSFEVERIYEVV